ncbi:hypothetical protein RND81_06G056000 [Saponaria officinalis]|uniref:Uncharacterized protein n=1 Tax=Saponaria officinalis TaxID=3572 RepID=A0AAW1K449_SAPOF
MKTVLVDFRRRFVVEGEEIPGSSQVRPWDTPGFCRRCQIRMDLEEDGRGGFWLGLGGSFLLISAGFALIVKKRVRLRLILIGVEVEGLVMKEIILHLRGLAHRLL